MAEELRVERKREWRKNQAVYYKTDKKENSIVQMFFLAAWTPVAVFVVENHNCIFSRINRSQT